MEYGCIAKKLGHSFSAEIHSLIGGSARSPRTSSTAS